MKPGENMKIKEAEHELASLLRGIEQAERVEEYIIRDHQIYQALGVGARLGYPVGVGLDLAWSGGPVIYLTLPTGEVSWGVLPFRAAGDGHDTPTKYARCRAYYLDR